ncbi:MAG: hypothetical protein JWN60_369 [Acidobacteria bacterium]|nr:hypothetical protein [Acidobacteriota bacterium]
MSRQSVKLSKRIRILADALLITIHPAPKLFRAISSVEPSMNEAVSKVDMIFLKTANLKSGLAFGREAAADRVKRLRIRK